MRRLLQRAAPVFGAFLLVSTLYGQADLDEPITEELESLLRTYEHLHSHPELSYQEKETSRYLGREIVRREKRHGNISSSRIAAQNTEPRTITLNGFASRTHPGFLFHVRRLKNLCLYRC